MGIPEGNIDRNEVVNSGGTISEGSTHRDLGTILGVGFSVMVLRYLIMHRCVIAMNRAGRFLGIGNRARWKEGGQV